MDGYTVGVFGTDPSQKASFASSIAKKSETEGIIVYHRNESGKRLSLLDDAQYPERIHGYSRIASISDYACYLFPRSAKLTPSDGELAILLDAFGLQGSVQILDGSATDDVVRSSFKGTVLEKYTVEHRASQSSIIDLSAVKQSPAFSAPGTVIYIDRSFGVKGVGTVVLGFVLCGKVSVHDRLRGVGMPQGKTVEVKGIQVNDEDFDSAGRGIRIGLSLKDIEVKELARTSWLDDGSVTLCNQLKFEFRQCHYYKPPVEGRDLHLQIPGEMVPARLTRSGSMLTASVASQLPVWDGMRVSVIDLNARNLRVAGGGLCIL